MSASKFYMYHLALSLTRSFRNHTSIILRLSHGYATRDGNDPLVELAHVANSQLSVATAPGVYYVDLLPFCTHSVFSTPPRILNLYSEVHSIVASRRRIQEKSKRVRNGFTGPRGNSSQLCEVPASKFSPQPH